jgi:magnesium transporter
MIRTCLVRAADGSVRSLQGSKLEELRQLRAEKNQLVWLDLLDPDAESLEALAKEFKIHPLGLEDMQKRRQRPKIDTYPDQHLIVTYEVLERRARRQRGHAPGLGEIHLIAGEGYLISTHWQPSPAIDATLERFRTRPEVVATSVGQLLYSVLDAVVDGYFPLLDKMAEEIDTLEDRILEGNARNGLRDVLDLKRALLELRRILAPQRDIANALLRRDVELIGDAEAPYYQDLYDHLLRVLDALDLYRDLVASALDANLSVTNNSLNAVMKRLTAFTVLLMVPTLIAGIYGMNFDNMPELRQPYGYFIALGAMALSIVAIGAYFRARDWF